MNTLQRGRRTQRNVKFNLESLDDRILPSTMHAAVGAGAEAVAAASVAQRHEQHLAQLEAKHAKAVERHELRLARREARFLAHHPNASASATTAPVTVSVFSLSHPKSASAAPSTRVAPSFSVPTTTVSPTPTAPTTPVTTTPPQSENPDPSTTQTIPTSPGPLPANVSQPLQTIYQEYQSFLETGGDIFTSSQANLVVLNGTNVGVQVHFNGGDFNAFIAQLQSEGLQVIAGDATYGEVDGMLPIAQLPTVATLSQTLSITPMYKPMLS
jgi:hypothetical protein